MKFKTIILSICLISIYASSEIIGANSSFLKGLEYDKIAKEKTLTKLKLFNKTETKSIIIKIANLRKKTYKSLLAQKNLEGKVYRLGAQDIIKEFYKFYKLRNKKYAKEGTVEERFVKYWVNKRDEFSYENGISDDMVRGLITGTYGANKVISNDYSFIIRKEVDYHPSVDVKNLLNPKEDEIKKILKVEDNNSIFKNGDIMALPILVIFALGCLMFFAKVERVLEIPCQSDKIISRIEHGREI